MKEIGSIRVSFLIAILVMMTCHAFSQFYVSPKVCASEPLPNPGTNPGTMPGATQGQACEENVQFFDTNLSSTAWQWDFGDGGVANTRNPNYVFKNSGNPIITLNRTLPNGTIETVSKNVNVGTYPNQPTFNKKIKADTTVCDGKTLTLNPYKLTLAGGDYNYLWFPGGETTKTIDVDTSGCYSVEVSDKVTGCSRTAIIKVKFCLQDAPSGGGSEKWYLGDGSILEFNPTGEPVERDSLKSEGELKPELGFTNIVFNGSISSKKHALNTKGGTSVVYDPKGNVAFYSDGNKVFAGSDDSEILNIDGTPFLGLGGNQSTAVYLVPKASCVECNFHQYYLFTVDPLTKLLSYSILDLRYNDKKGAVVAANIPVYYPVTEQMVVTPNADATGYVIYTHEPGNSVFSTISVDSLGVNSKVQTSGALQTGIVNDKNYFSTSPNGRRFAQGVVLGGKNYIELFDIDANGNRLNSPQLIDLNIPAPPFVYGLTFSENSDILYVSISGDPSKGQTSYLIQLALFLNNPAAIAAQKEIIASSTTERYGALQLGPIKGEGAKYVYMSIEGKSYLPFIQSPDVKGDANAIGYSDRAGSANRGVPLKAGNGLGLSNVIKPDPEQDGDGLAADYSGNCFNAPTTLTTQGVCSPMRNEVTWVFEDGTTKEGEQVSYTFPKLGWNKIKMKVKIFNKSPVEKIINQKQVIEFLETECEEKEFNGEIYIKPSPILTLPEKFYVCFVEGEKKPLGPATKGGNSFTYNWQTSLGTTITPGGLDSAFTFFAPAVYKLDVKNNFDCETKTRLNVLEGCEPRLFFPEVFSPNGDTINDDFKVEYAHITFFDLRIFNRWGEIVFATDKPEIRWNGQVRGKIFGNQMYPYVLKYRSKYFPERGLLSVRGAVTIIK